MSVVAEVIVRPLTLDDVDQAVQIQVAAFADLAVRVHEPPTVVTEALLERSRLRHRHFITHDARGSWAATVDGKLIGCGLALRREGLWGLSLLVVDPAAQSAGAGRKLLNATLDYADGCQRGVILASTDARAIRAYATSGFALFPQVAASGKPTLDATPASVSRVRDGNAADRALADVIDRGVRGAGRGADHEVISASGGDMYVVDDADGRGYAYLRGGEVYLLAATDDDTATALLWRCFMRGGELGLETHVDHMTGEQQWAIAACFAARLAVRPGGPVFWRGATPPRAYVPSGAFL
jgi:GNAT superfamily N-acetyltransferase